MSEVCEWEPLANRLVWSPECHPKYQPVIGDVPDCFSFCPYCGKPIHIQEKEQ